MDDRAFRTERIRTLVIGGGQAGLSVGYHLSRRGVPFVIADAAERIGDSWRGRWDSLRLFTPAALDGLDGMAFPGEPHSFPTKDEMADYLEAYADRFDLPVRSGVRIERLTRRNGRFLAEAGDRAFEADDVVVAMASYQKPYVPSFAAELDPRIVQLHSADYRNPGQLADGPTLLVGAGNSGSEIAMELGRTRRVWMSGRDVGQIPFRIEGTVGRLFGVRIVVRVLFHRVLTVRTPLGRKVRPELIRKGGPLIRVKASDLAARGIERVPRTAGVERGLPVLDDGTVIEPANVVWCTGFRPGFDWIDLPVHGDREPLHRSGVVEREPGLYFVGLHFLHALSSTMIHGVGRDADRIADLIARGAPARERGSPKALDRSGTAA